VVVYRFFNFIVPTVPALIVRPQVEPLLDAADEGRFPHRLGTQEGDGAVKPALGEGVRCMTEAGLPDSPAGNHYGCQMPDRVTSGAPEDPGDSLFGSRRRKRIAGTVLVAALLGGGVWFLIGQAASFSKLVDALKRADPWWLVLAVAAVGVGYVGYALMYQAVANVERGPRPALPLTLRVAVAIFGASIVATAAGRLGGEYWTLRRMREKPPQAWARVLALNTAQWAMLAAFAWSGALIMLLGAGRRAPLEVELGWLLVPPACAIPAIYLSSPQRRELARDEGGRLRRGFASVVRAIVLLRLAAARRRTLLRGVAGGILHWGGEFVTVWAALRAFGSDIGYAQLVVGYATGYLVTILPLPAGGAGGVEAAGTYALTLVGVPLSPALLATLVQRVCTYWLPLAVALLAARSVKRLGGDLADVPRPAERGPEREMALA